VADVRKRRRPTVVPVTDVDGPDRRVPAEPLLVEVHADGQWWPGRLIEWQKWPTGWTAYVTWTVAPGSTYLRWVGGDRVRPRG
jgi:hypothetical protein